MVVQLGDQPAFKVARVEDMSFRVLKRAIRLDGEIPAQLDAHGVIARLVLEGSRSHLDLDQVTRRLSVTILHVALHQADPVLAFVQVDVMKLAFPAHQRMTQRTLQK